MGKKITISEKDFTEIVERLEHLEQENQDLKDANYFLNKQVREFNERFNNETHSKE